MQGIREWYPTLVKPLVNPRPGFWPGVDILYLMMGIAAFLVWRKGLDAPGVKKGSGFS